MSGAGAGLAGGDPRAAPSPADSDVLAVLREIFTPASVSLDRREKWIGSGSYPTEIVTCRAGGEEHILFCKYEETEVRVGDVHRGGLQLELDFYREVLECLDLPRAPFHGGATDPVGRTWLVLGYLDGAQGVNKSTDPGAMSIAARWAGRLHAFTRNGAVPVPARTAVYDAAYYLRWARRTLELTAPFHEEAPWLPRLCARFEASIERLVGAPRVVIHGEYYPKNVLYRDGVAYPVDWESAALAAGEVDLASLTEGWPDEVQRRCEHEYASERWPGGAPSDFDETLLHARLYTLMRWLGDRSEWTLSASGRAYVAELRRVGERAGLP